MARWILLIALTALATVGLTYLDVDAAALFAGLVVAGALAIAGRAPTRATTSDDVGTDTAGTSEPETPETSARANAESETDAAPDQPIIPRPIFLASQGILGVFIGTMADPETLSGLGSSWLPVLVIGVGTLALSMAVGLALGLHKDVDPLTGSLALVAGGASGLVVLARELGGDERMVAVIQYVRVALVTITIPLVATLTANTGSGTTAEAAATTADQGWGLLLLAVCIGVGIPLGRLIRLPAAGLLGPMALATIAELTGIAGDAAVSPALLTCAYAVIGWQAGLGFTMERLKAVGRVLPLAIVLIVVLGIGSAILGMLLSWWTGESMFDSYLATTPGGIYAVLAAATAAGSNVAFVVAAQILRVLLMLFIAPFAARAIARRR